MNSTQVAQMQRLVTKRGFDVSFKPLDFLNPQVGISCIIEGPFGRVSGDSDCSSTSEAFSNALLQLAYVAHGWNSNVQPVLSPAESILKFDTTSLEKMASAIQAELQRRQLESTLAEMNEGVVRAVREAFAEE